MQRVVPLGLVMLVALLAGCGGGGGHSLVVGAVEDAAKSDDPVSQMQRAAQSGFGAIALSALWTVGARSPSAGELAALRAATAAAAHEHVRPVLAIYQFSGDTPVSPGDRADFAAFAAALLRGLPDVDDVIVGNEPNLNLFWLPQFTPAGDDAAAPAYEALLAATYDALKAVRDVRVIGGGLAPRGSDDPAASRPTHSPTAFITDLGAAYRASGRTRPLLDAFAIHPYGESPRVPPTLRHPHSTSLGIADYPKLRGLLRQAFGEDVPVVYGEYGVETRIPPAKRALYSGREVVRPVDETTQARYYEQAIALAACQPTVDMILLFHVQDEPRLEGLQSGVRYADGSAKSSLPAVRDAAAHPVCQP